MFAHSCSATTFCSPSQLNAFDSRHLDEIYFDVRLTAFQEATRRVRDMQTLDLDYINIIIHNCFHTYEVSRRMIQVQSGLIQELQILMICFPVDRRHVAGGQRHLVSIYSHYPTCSGWSWRADLQGHCAAHNPGRSTQGAPQQDRGTELP